MALLVTWPLLSPLPVSFSTSQISFPKIFLYQAFLLSAYYTLGTEVDTVMSYPDPPSGLVVLAAQRTDGSPQL